MSTDSFDPLYSMYMQSVRAALRSVCQTGLMPAAIKGRQWRVCALRLPTQTPAYLRGRRWCRRSCSNSHRQLASCTTLTTKAAMAQRPKSAGQKAGGIHQQRRRQKRRRPGGQQARAPDTAVHKAQRPPHPPCYSSRMRLAPFGPRPPLRGCWKGAAGSATSRGVASPAYSTNTGSRERCSSGALPSHMLAKGMPSWRAFPRNCKVGGQVWVGHGWGGGRGTGGGA